MTLTLDTSTGTDAGRDTETDSDSETDIANTDPIRKFAKHIRLDLAWVSSKAEANPKHKV